MCAKNFPLEVFWRALLDIYAIGVYILKFNISKPEYGCRHCRPFFSKKVAKQIQSNILTGSFFKEVREGINGETDYVKAALDFVYML